MTACLHNENYKTRDKKSIRVLLLATSQVSAHLQDFQFLQDRLKVFVIAGHRGWAAALTALPDLELQQLRVQLPPPAPLVLLSAPAPPVQYSPVPMTLLNPDLLRIRIQTAMETAHFRASDRIGQSRIEKKISEADPSFHWLNSSRSKYGSIWVGKKNFVDKTSQRSTPFWSKIALYI